MDQIDTQPDGVDVTVLPPDGGGTKDLAGGEVLAWCQKICQPRGLEDLDAKRKDKHMRFIWEALTRSCSELLLFEHNTIRGLLRLLEQEYPKAYKAFSDHDVLQMLLGKVYPPAQLMAAIYFRMSDGTAWLKGLDAASNGMAAKAVNADKVFAALKKGLDANNVVEPPKQRTRAEYMAERRAVGGSIIRRKAMGVKSGHIKPPAPQHGPDSGNAAGPALKKPDGRTARWETFWHTQYAALEKLSKTKGTANIGAEDDAVLWKWLEGQRRQKKAGELSAAREAKLTALGVKWVTTAVRSVPVGGTPRPGRGHNMRTGEVQRARHLRNWQGRLDALLELAKTTGTVNIGPDDDTGLWKWLCAQRTAKTNGTLSMEREKKMAEAGISVLTLMPGLMARIPKRLSPDMANRFCLLAFKEGKQPDRLVMEAMELLLREREAAAKAAKE